MVRERGWRIVVFGSFAGSAMLGCEQRAPVTGTSPPPADASAADTVQRRVIENTEVRALPRSANGRDYLLYVALPDSYAEHPGARYPVLYLCDGYWDFNLVKGFYGNLLYDKVVPEFILVGFGYAGEKPDYGVLRRWDYTPVPEDRPGPDAGASGHAREFLDVIEHEMIPFVERQYRVNPSYRVLGGSSLGGLFTLYTALTKPSLFQAYIAPSPAVSWADDWLFGYEEAFFKRGEPLRGRLFMTGAGDESPKFLEAVRRFDTRLRERAYPGMAYTFRLIDGERHAGTKAESYNRGVRFAFAPLAPRDAPP
jgi:predicted alpha/beta superfamily hydrolase